MDRTCFYVLAELRNAKLDLNAVELTAHWSVDRITRHNNIAKVLGRGREVATFEIYGGHINGEEIHHIYDNGTIIIQNKDTKKLITEIVARVPQIFRYWNGLNITFPEKLRYVIKKAKENEDKGYNYNL